MATETSGDHGPIIEIDENFVGIEIRGGTSAGANPNGLDLTALKGEREMNRDEMKHRLSKLLLDDKLHLASFSNGKGRILDLGTGPGHWCVEIAEQYPSASVIGTDLSKIQPDRIQQNVKYEIEDFEDEWPYGCGAFDFNHSRFNITAVSNWPRLFHQASNALKPGGYIELVDLTNPAMSDDNTIPEGSQLAKFLQLVTDGCGQTGRDLFAPQKWQTELEEAGFQNVQQRILKAPVGAWPKGEKLKEAGRIELESLQVGRSSYVLVATTLVTYYFV